MAIVAKGGEPKRMMLAVGCLLIVIPLLLVASTSTSSAVQIAAYVGVAVFGTAALVLIYIADLIWRREKVAARRRREAEQGPEPSG